MIVLKRLFRKRKMLSDFKGSVSAEELLKIFDVFYVCFDEPNRFENWVQIKKEIPWAQKIEGVHGFDRALKTCAKLSKTKHFFLIDGDNQVLLNRFKKPIHLENPKDDWVLSWSSLNRINGLAYGNGGLKLWPKDVALEIRTHENATEDEDQTDYCFIAKYYLIDDYLTQTHVNKTPEQAFRAGIREGFKMSLDGGKQIELNRENFFSKIVPQNRERLKVWCDVGADVENGYWAILGARIGFMLNVIDRVDYKVINSYEWIENYFEHKVIKKLFGANAKRDDLLQNMSGNESSDKLIAMIKAVGYEINKALPIDLRLMSPEESAKFKENFKNPPRSGLLRPEQ